MTRRTQLFRVAAPLTLGLAVSLAALCGSTQAQASVQSPRVPLAPLPGLQLLEDNDDSSFFAPLLSTALHVEVDGSTAHSRLSQTFENPGDATVDAVYRFPLPASAKVDHFEVRIGERVITGKLTTPELAKKAYERARRQKRSAASLQWDSPHWFSVRVANLPAGDSLEVVLRYHQEISYSNGTHSIRFPSAASSNTGAPSYSEGSDGPWLHAEVTLSPPGGARAVFSPSHVLDTQPTDEGAIHVRLKYGPLLADRDFQLQWQQAAPLPSTQQVKLPPPALKPQLLSRHTSWVAADSQISVETLGPAIRVRTLTPADHPMQPSTEFAEPNEPTCRL